jgi:glycosyltransferase involved in cell wall biosynthesis
LTTAPPFLPILGYLINLLKGTSYVCLIYDLYPDVAEQLGVVAPEHWAARLWNFLNRKTWDRAKAIIVLSPTMKEQILAKHPHLADKIEIISNWADPDWIVPLEKENNWFAQEHHLTEKFTVLYSGNMGRCHDMDTLLEAARLLQDEPNIQFVFIGGGAKYRTSLETIRQWGLKNCLFLPYQDRNVLPYSLTACDLSLVSVEAGMSGVVAPSKLYTTLAAGRPVALVSDEQCYLRKTLEQAHWGVAFLNGDSLGLASFIRELDSKRGTAKSMGEAGRSYLIAHYTLESIAKHYAEVLGVKLQPLSNQSESKNEIPSQGRVR